MRLHAPWIQTHATAHPKRVAIEFDGLRTTYAELYERARDCAGRLRSRGVRRGDVVAVLMETGLPFIELLHAVDLCDAVLLPLNARLTPRELAFPLGDSAARLLVHADDALADKAIAAASIAPGVDAAPLAQTGRATRETRSEPWHGETGAPFAVLYTSGTTGRPKGACLSRENLLSSALASALHTGVLPTDRWLACMPLFHVGGLSIPVRSAIYGTTAVLQSGFDPEAVAQALEGAAVSMVSLTPTMLKRLLDHRPNLKPPSRLRAILLGGGPCPASLALRAERQGLPIAPTYGLTEACSQVATRNPGDADAPVEAMQPLPGTELRIVDERGRPLPAATPGEIQVRSATVMIGYLNQPEETSKVLRDGWLCTGDIGSLDEFGRLRVIDRRSDLIVSGGENVYPAEIEAVLQEHAAVAEAGVAGVPDPDFGKRAAAWWVLAGGAQPPTEVDLRAFCRERLAGFKVPIAFHRVDELPRNASGKLLRRQLPPRD